MSLQAQEKVLVYLAQRDHSPKELFDKLIKRFPAQECQEAIDWANQKGWIKSDEELAEKTYKRLSEKNKGILYINQYLCSKGLPAVDSDPEHEAEKALELLQRKFNKDDLTDYKHKQKAMMVLKNKGFEFQSIMAGLNRFLHEDDL